MLSEKLKNILYQKLRKKKILETGEKVKKKNKKTNPKKKLGFTKSDAREGWKINNFNYFSDGITL